MYVHHIIWRHGLLKCLYAGIVTKESFFFEMFWDPIWAGKDNAEQREEK